MQITLQGGESTTIVQAVAADKQLGIRACGYPDGVVAVVVKTLDGTISATQDFHLSPMDGPYWQPVGAGTWLVEVSFTRERDGSSYGLCDVVEA
jgi:hypothetical protein